MRGAQRYRSADRWYPSRRSARNICCRAGLRIQRAAARPHAAAKCAHLQRAMPFSRRRRCPEATDEGTATRIAHPATAARGTRHDKQCAMQSATAPIPNAPFGTYRRTLPSTATLRTGFSSRPSPSRPSVAKTHHTRLRNISWLLLANRRHRRILGQARINHFFYRNPGNSDESSRLVRITNRLNVNFSSWSHQRQTDPTAV